MKNKLLLLFIYFLFFISSWGQNQSQNFIKVNNYSFFDNKIKNLMSNNLASFDSKLKSSNTNGVYYDNYNGKYFEINNNYVYLKKDYGNNLIINVNNSTPKYYESKIVPQLLNDSLLLAFEGKIINIHTGQFLTTRVGQNNILTEIKNPNQIEFDGNILKTDILMQDIDDCEPRNFIYNILSEGFFIHDQGNAFRGKILDNPQSKYLKFTENYIGKNSEPGVLFWRFCLMNRFNVNDTIDIPSFLSEAIIYNDSMVYYSVPIKNSYKLLNYQFNTNLNIDLSENNFGTNNGNHFFQKFLRGSYDTDEANNAVATSYFHKKYNKMDVSNKSFEEFTSFYKTYKNLLNYCPYLIVEYNFREKKIKSILDKPLLPLTGISAMYIDRGNQFLIVQQPNNQFTIFNLKTKKEVITLSGNISGINNKNELLINVLAPRQTSYNSSIPAYIELTKLNLNELKKISDQSFVSEFDSPLNFDEFTTKADFNSKIITKTNSNNLINPEIETIANKTQNIQYKHNLYSNEYVNSFLDKSINDYVNVINSGANKNDLVYKLKYLTYSMDNKLLEFMTDELEEDEQNFLSNFGTNEFEISDQRYAGKNYSILRFKNISIEDAKKFKSDTCFIIVKNTKPKTFKMPEYLNLFVFRHFNIIKKNFYYNNEPEQEQSKKFYNSFVPINTNIANYYNSWYFRFNNRDILLYPKN